MVEKARKDYSPESVRKRARKTVFVTIIALASAIILGTVAYIYISSTSEDCPPTPPTVNVAFSDVNNSAPLLDAQSHDWVKIKQMGGSPIAWDDYRVFIENVKNDTRYELDVSGHETDTTGTNTIYVGFVDSVSDAKAHSLIGEKCEILIFKNKTHVTIIDGRSMITIVDNAA